MLGAIIGDIIGSRWEFSPTNNYDFELFSDKNDFTDDTICTIAIADALLRGVDFGQCLHEWCRRYPSPKGGYGGRFAQWVHSSSPRPYGSFGNGSAMRVSPVAWFYSNVDDVLEAAKASAECTHNHAKGILGAKAVAKAIYDYKSYREDPYKSEFSVCPNYAEQIARVAGYRTDIRLEDVQNRFDETCAGTVPVAFWIVEQSNSFEDAVRRAVALGADADTLGAIVGSIAEVKWNIPDWIAQKALSYLPDEMKEVLNNFRARVKKNRNKYTDEELYWCTGGHTGTLPSRVSPSMINSLRKNEIFVFGSNIHGAHNAGAARIARVKFGAQMGNGEGLQGSSYAIPTMEGLQSTTFAINRFTAFASKNPDLRFYVTAIGCGIAGYTPEQIAPLFFNAAHLKNVYLPLDFWKVLLDHAK